MSKLIPDQLPLNNNALKDLQRIRATEQSRLFTECGQELRNTMDQCLESVQELKELAPLLESLAECAAALEKQETEYSTMALNLEIAKKQYTTESEKCKEVTLETWDEYVDKTLEAPDFLDVLKMERSEEIKSQTRHLPTSRISDTNKILRILPQIWENPRCVLPDDNDDEDDLMIDGGIIELTCPITCRMYEKPLISKKCSHVFDETGLKSYFSKENHRDCPQTGCSKQLTFRDFIPDPVMALRCQIAKIQETKHLDVGEQESLDVL
ncbi:similar to Saccharomyces cerevisiae YEL019C MMS21 SUMO ligase involved in chromosomal organization and DNA repair [Maudiozyma barnettii]|uniref:Similar to Saccharomyces cerevisiae YEL019C MMS21 SUMO ligase involved in chromosomal organization and DNA repair n=1 Tax=Maudiozyma barnettii TaxID=61262 RepID=A0A8H2VCJ6_9SACH|nr:SUMO ligase MMS21 [Kazachstania barnettii]CAB4252764.1 similar to Saccharomyces cerevisiae YEL019C MMS21 SUMO ligase involved in chromosomal organization and DNA repair [Kazachstania barnettii]CAD1780554.1 similar to Saccharomyces cerevisiae YEL019C MMS21 SUMO ligase involved in chromosomal organization and DNA repair [Kazachstania barnettii]